MVVGTHRSSLNIFAPPTDSPGKKVLPSAVCRDLTASRKLSTRRRLKLLSDIADGYTELNNTPRTRRVKTVFFAMRHAAEDMAARAECMETMRELFRQFMSRLLPEKVRLEQNCIYLDPRISFNEIDSYFFPAGPALTFR